MVAKIDKTPVNVQLLILKSAEKRFLDFGFNKTTMAEIAKDCQMSASNIYRFFPSKLDIAANLTCSYLKEESDALQSVVANKRISATERLWKFIFTLFDKTYNARAEQPRIIETVITICNERMDIVEKHIQRKHALLIALLEDGVNNNEFYVEDLQATAEAISTALTLFNGPLYMPMYTREVFERKAKGVFYLIINGLKKQ